MAKNKSNFWTDFLKLFIHFVLFVLFLLVLEILAERVIDSFFNIKGVYVPRLVGLPLKDALQKAAKLGLILKIDEEKYDYKYPKNYITFQNPYPGKYVKEGRRVLITLSKGFLIKKIPDVRGKYLRTAEIIIKNNGYLIGKKSYVFSKKYNDGQVISQNPLPDGYLLKGKQIDLLISKGKKLKTFIMPDLFGKSLTQLQKLVDEYDLNLNKVKYEYSPAYPRGVIISQLPAAGVLAKEGTGIDVIVNDEVQNGQKDFSATKKLKEIEVNFTMPPGTSTQPKELRIIVVDEIGTREVFSKKCLPQENVNFKIKGQGEMRVLFYVDGIVVDNKTY